MRVSMDTEGMRFVVIVKKNVKDWHGASCTLDRLAQDRLAQDRLAQDRLAQDLQAASCPALRQSGKKRICRASRGKRESAGPVGEKENLPGQSGKKENPGAHFCGRGTRSTKRGGGAQSFMMDSFSSKPRIDRPINHPSLRDSRVSVNLNVTD